MLCSTATIVNAIVEFYRLIPVVAIGPRVETVVTRSLRGEFFVSVLTIGGEVCVQRFTKDVIEIILCVKTLRLVVSLTKIFGARRFSIRLVLTRHMVGHKVNNHLQTSSVCALNECLKFLHTIGHADSKVGVDIVIVLNGVRRTRLPLHNNGIVFSNAEVRITGLGSMLQKSGIPNVRITTLLNALQYFSRKVVHLATTILGECAALHILASAITKEARKHLINIHSLILVCLLRL